mmetsp:Transcript_77327/g.151731  ORF Transcript_77327/g.151731 Transcript_77327/m.151731 type:complete len:223 (+) Transcript_77327:420-1088(+)
MCLKATVGISPERSFEGTCPTCPKPTFFRLVWSAMSWLQTPSADSHATGRNGKRCEMASSAAPRFLHFKAPCSSCFNAWCMSILGSVLRQGRLLNTAALPPKAQHVWMRCRPSTRKCASRRLRRSEIADSQTHTGKNYFTSSDRSFWAPARAAAVVLGRRPHPRAWRSQPWESHCRFLAAAKVCAAFVGPALPTRDCADLAGAAPLGDRSELYTQTRLEGAL